MEPRHRPGNFDRPGLRGYTLDRRPSSRARVAEFADRGEHMAFVRATAAAEIPPGKIREVTVSGKALAIANVAGQFYAIDNTCLHRGGPLGDGPLEGTIVTCPWHGWQYDVTTGKILQSPDAGVAHYKVEVRDQDIFVDLG
jgi:nitrite reductase (NADH) small subunit